MPRRTVVLTEHHERVISDLVASGRYRDASEVLREGLRLIEDRDARDAAKLKMLQEAARLGFADIDAGRFLEVEEDAIADVIKGLGRRASALEPPALILYRIGSTQTVDVGRVLHDAMELERHTVFHVPPDQ